MNKRRNRHRSSPSHKRASQGERDCYSSDSDHGEKENSQFRQRSPKDSYRKKRHDTRSPKQEWSDSDEDHSKYKSRRHSPRPSKKRHLSDSDEEHSKHNFRKLESVRTFRQRDSYDSDEEHSKHNFRKLESVRTFRQRDSYDSDEDTRNQKSDRNSSGRFFQQCEEPLGEKSTRRSRNRNLSEQDKDYQKKIEENSVISHSPDNAGEREFTRAPKNSKHFEFSEREAGYSYSQDQRNSARSRSPIDRPLRGYARESRDRYSSVSEAGYSYSQDETNSARSLSSIDRPLKGSATDSRDRYSSVSEAGYSYSQGQGKSAGSPSPIERPRGSAILDRYSSVSEAGYSYSKARGSARDSIDRYSSVSEAGYSYSKDQGKSARSPSPIECRPRGSARDYRDCYSSVSEACYSYSQGQGKSARSPSGIERGPRGSERDSRDRYSSVSEAGYSYPKHQGKSARSPSPIERRPRGSARDSRDRYSSVSEAGYRTYSKDQGKSPRSPSPIEHRPRGSARDSRDHYSSVSKACYSFSQDQGNYTRSHSPMQYTLKVSTKDSRYRYSSLRENEDERRPITRPSRSPREHYPVNIVKRQASARSSEESDYSDTEQETRYMRQEMKASGKRKIRESTERYLHERDTEDKRRRTRSPSPIEDHFPEKAVKGNRQPTIGPSARSSEECDSSDKEEIRHVKHDKKGDGKRKATDSTERDFSVRDTEDKRSRTRSRSPIGRHFPENVKEKQKGDGNRKSRDSTERYFSVRDTEDKRRPTRSRSPIEGDLPQNLKQKEKHDGNRKARHSTESYSPVRDTSKDKSSIRSLSPIGSSFNLEEDSYSIQGKGKSVRHRSARSSQQGHFSEMGEETDLNQEKRKPRGHSPTRHSEEEDCSDTDRNLKQKKRKGRCSSPGPGHSDANDYSDSAKQTMKLREKNSSESRDRYSALTGTPQNNQKKRGASAENIGHCEEKGALKSKPSVENNYPNRSEIRKQSLDGHEVEYDEKLDKRKQAARVQSPFLSGKSKDSHKLDHDNNTLNSDEDTSGGSTGHQDESGPVDHSSPLREENPGIKCVFCDADFPSNSEAKEHIYSSHLKQNSSSSSFSCHECNFETQDSAVFTSHFKDIHQTHVQRGKRTVSDPVMTFFENNKQPTVYRFNKMLASNNLHEVKIPGNGFCFLSALLVTLQERGIETDFNNVCLQVMNELRVHALAYMEYAVESKQPAELDKDQFLTKCAEFFQEGNYSHAYVDVCIGACANALGVNLLIFQKFPRYVSMSTFLCERGYSSPVCLYLQFYASKKKNSNNLDAHYNCYVNDKYWKEKEAQIKSQMIVTADVDLKSDRLLAQMIQAKTDSQAGPSGSTDGTTDDLIKGGRYVSRNYFDYSVAL